MHRYPLLLLFTFIFSGLSAQNQVQKHLLESGKTLQTNQSVSAIAVKSVEDLGSELIVWVNGVVHEVPLDPDAPEFTYFISLPSIQLAPEVRFENGSGELEVFFIYSGKPPVITPEKNGARKHSDCPIEFSPIEQSVWRAGLTAPSYPRSFTDVQHVVVHHAAGSNTNTNYVQVVRDIYVYHTDVNGWSDIGYNYLVAQDGTIFTGRDPGTGEQDNVIGAHFCGKNSGTMGICLLGNYETATPTSKTLTSLKTLVSFKIQKEGLDPLGQYPHAFGTLDAIIGHRDGCSTACPGENVYTLLGDIRTDVKGLLETCEEKSLAFSVSYASPKVNEYITFYNESVGYDSYQWTLEQAEEDTQTWESSGSARWKRPGVFSVSLIGRSGELADTLIKEDFIQVEGANVYPTLVESGAKIFLRSDMQIESIVSVDGKPTRFEKQEQNAYQLFPVDAGVYFIRLSSGKTERVVIY